MRALYLRNESIRHRWTAPRAADFSLRVPCAAARRGFARDRCALTVFDECCALSTASLNKADLRRDLNVLGSRTATAA